MNINKNSEYKSRVFDIRLKNPSLNFTYSAVLWNRVAIQKKSFLLKITFRKNFSAGRARLVDGLLNVLSGHLMTFKQQRNGFASQEVIIVKNACRRVYRLFYFEI